MVTSGCPGDTPRHAALESAYSSGVQIGSTAVHLAASRPASWKSTDQSGIRGVADDSSTWGGIAARSNRRPRPSSQTRDSPDIMVGGSEGVTPGRNQSWKKKARSKVRGDCRYQN